MAGLRRRSFICGLLLSVLTMSCTLPVHAGDQMVMMQTTKGPILMRIFYSIVPYTAGNFLDLVGQGFYDGLSFHRIENWCVQGGDPNGNGSGNYVDPATGRPRFINLEINNKLGHGVAGMVAMARSNNKNSASCQFYILKSPMPGLNGQYAVFGKVVNGMNTVYALQRGDRILSAQVSSGGGGGGGGGASSGGNAYSGPGPSAAGGTEFGPPDPPPNQNRPMDSGF